MLRNAKRAALLSTVTLLLCEWLVSGELLTPYDVGSGPSQSEIKIALDRWAKCWRFWELRDCCDVFFLPPRLRKTGLFQIGGALFTCDMDTSGGGWMVFQRRIFARQQLSRYGKLEEVVDKPSTFWRPWNEYVNGFGNVTDNYWLGLKALHEITKDHSVELRIELDHGDTVMQYGGFRVGGPDSSYNLTLWNHHSDTVDMLFCHNGSKFSTLDEDNDDNCQESCSRKIGGGGWWFHHSLCAHFSPHGFGISGVETKNCRFWAFPNQIKDFVYMEMKLRVNRFPCSR